MITARREPFPLVIVDDFLDEISLAQVMKEVRGLWDANLVQPDTGTARENGSIIKTGQGVVLDDLYKNRSRSATIRFTETLFGRADIWQTSRNTGDWFLADTLSESNRHGTLVNFYMSGQQYRPHRDGSRITALLVLTEHDVVISGGEFVFPDYDITLSLRSNQMIIFPSVIRHGCNPITITGFDGPARYSVALFIDRL